MQLKYILFDLDGTLLPMDQDAFTKRYLGALAKKMAPIGFEPEKLIQSIWTGVSHMIKNDGNKTNEEVFWRAFEEIYGTDVKKYIPEFDAFYRNEFIAAKDACEFNESVSETIKNLKSRGLKLVLATNPIFPAVATERRIDWAGLDKNDFVHVTTYENSKFSKPNLKYYGEILEKIQAKPEECLMVGNDVSEDMVARELGIDVFLIPACLINKKDEDVSVYHQGSFSDLLEYVDKS